MLLWYSLYPVGGVVWVLAPPPTVSTERKEMLLDTLCQVYSRDLHNLLLCHEHGWSSCVVFTVHSAGNWLSLPVLPSVLGGEGGVLFIFWSQNCYFKCKTRATKINKLKKNHVLFTGLFFSSLFHPLAHPKRTSCGFHAEERKRVGVSQESRALPHLWAGASLTGHCCRRCCRRCHRCCHHCCWMPRVFGYGGHA